MAKRSTISSLGNFFRYSDMRLILLSLAASVYGCMLVFSANTHVGNGMRGTLVHIVATTVGMTAALFISQIDHEDICRRWPIWAGVSLLLVLLTLTPLGLGVNGADDKAWLGVSIGSFRITFQPAELMKITFIITFSVHLSRVQKDLHRFGTVLLLGLHALVPVALVFLQGDDGTALVFVMIFLAMMFVAGVNILYYVIGLAAVSGVFPLLWTFVLADDKKARILCILPPFVDKYLKTKGWQQYEGLKAIGSGRLTGVGFLQGGRTDTPVSNNDMIYTVACEEFGFIGGILVMLLLLGILLELAHCARHARDTLGSFLCVGMLSMIAFQSIINLGMALRVLPVIGITLPFFSAGGSSVATLYLGIGLALSVAFSQKARRPGTLV